MCVAQVSVPLGRCVRLCVWCRCACPWGGVSGCVCGAGERAPGEGCQVVCVVQVSVPLGRVEIMREVAGEETMTCQCRADMASPCGADSDCINRLMLYECHPAMCPAGERCLNQRFQRRQDADAMPVRTEARGWGLQARSAIHKVSGAGVVGPGLGPAGLQRHT